MEKELEDLLIEFDEMGYEPTTLCENPQREIEIFRNRLKQAITELKAIKEAKPSEALKGLEYICKILNEKSIDIKWLFKEEYNTIKQALLKAQEQNMKYNEINKTFNDSHICEIKKEFAKYTPLCEESKCEECSLGIGDGICLKNVFEKKWESQIKAQELEKVLEIIKTKRVITAWFEDSYLTLNEYNAKCEFGYELTQEEFVLLKRWSEK